MSGAVCNCPRVGSGPRGYSPSCSVHGFGPLPAEAPSKCARQECWSARDTLREAANILLRIQERDALQSLVADAELPDEMRAAMRVELVPFGDVPKAMAELFDRITRILRGGAA